MKTYEEYKNNLTLEQRLDLSKACEEEREAIRLENCRIIVAEVREEAKKRKEDQQKPLPLMREPRAMPA